MTGPNEDKYLLIRLDERVKSLDGKLDDVAGKVGDIHKEFRKDYVTQKEFYPIKRAVYTFIGVMLTAVVTGFVYLLLGLKG